MNINFTYSDLMSPVLRIIFDPWDFYKLILTWGWSINTLTWWLLFFDRRHFSKTLVSVHQSKGGSTDTFQLNWFTKATGRCNQSFWNFRAIGRPVASLSLRPVNLEAWGHIMSCKQVGVTFFITSLTDSIFFSVQN